MMKHPFNMLTTYDNLINSNLKDSLQTRCLSSYQHGFHGVSRVRRDDSIDADVHYKEQNVEWH